VVPTHPSVLADPEVVRHADHDDQDAQRLRRGDPAANDGGTVRASA